MYSSLFTPADLAADALADIKTIGANLEQLSPEQLQEAKGELVQLAQRVRFWGRLADRQEAAHG